MAGDDGILRVVLVLGSGALVLLVVAAADAARLDAKERVVGADSGTRKLPVLDRLRLQKHRRAYRLGHANPPRDHGCGRARVFHSLLEPLSRGFWHIWTHP